MPRFLIDAQLPHGLAQRLREQGHEAAHVRDTGLSEALDLDIWRFAAARGMAQFSKDEDFARLSQIETGGPQFVWIRLGNTSNQKLWQTLQPVLADILEALERGDRLIEVRER